MTLVPKCGQLWLGSLEVSTLAFFYGTFGALLSRQVLRFHWLGLDGNHRHRFWVELVLVTRPTVHDHRSIDPEKRARAINTQRRVEQGRNFDQET